MAYHSLGRAEDSDRALRMILEWEDEVDRLWILRDVFAWRGDNDELFQILLERPALGVRQYRGIIFQPQYAQVRSDPRWTQFREAIGMSAERLDAIDFNPQLPQ